MMSFKNRYLSIFQTQAALIRNHLRVNLMIQRAIRTTTLIATRHHHHLPRRVVLHKAQLMKRTVQRKLEKEKQSPRSGKGM